MYPREACFTHGSDCQSSEDDARGKEQVVLGLGLPVGNFPGARGYGHVVHGRRLEGTHITHASTTAS